MHTVNTAVHTAAVEAARRDASPAGTATALPRPPRPLERPPPPPRRRSVRLSPSVRESSLARNAKSRSIALRRGRSPDDHDSDSSTDEAEKKLIPLHFRRG